MGWNYWYNWTIVLPAELSAAAVLIDFWDKNTKVNSAWVTICLVVVVAINFMGAGKSCDFPLFRSAAADEPYPIWRT
jgi:amino acid transporter